MMTSWIDEVKFDKDGLVPAIAQDYKNYNVLMMAWMNKESLLKTVECGQAVYWSRSRKKIWHKGEESGHIQLVHEIRLDCDNDVILLKVNQLENVACHTGRNSCFFRLLTKNKSNFMSWTEIGPVLKKPEEIYKK